MSLKRGSNLFFPFQALILVTKRSLREIDHFKFYFDSFLLQNPLKYVIRRCPVKFWAQYWPSWLLRTLKKFEKNHHHLLRITTFFITDCGILQVTWPLMSNQKLKQQNKTICFSFWLVKSGHVTCRIPKSVIKKEVILQKWWWFFSNFLRTLSSQEGQFWAQNSTGHLLIVNYIF